MKQESLPTEKYSHEITMISQWFDGVYVKGNGHRVSLDISSWDYQIINVNITKFEVYGDDKVWHTMSTPSNIGAVLATYLIVNSGDSLQSIVYGKAYLYRITGTFAVIPRTEIV